HLDVVTITTGVVRSPELGKGTARSPAPVENVQENQQSCSATENVKPPAPRPPTAKEYVRAVVESPIGEYPGRIVEGSFWVADDYVNVVDLAGGTIGSKPHHGDAAAIARQILKEKRGGYRRLVYPDLGIV